VNKEVNLTKRIKTPNGLRFCPVIRANNGRIKADHVLVDGRAEHHPEGCYYIEWYVGSKRVRRSVGREAGRADAKRHLQEGILAAKHSGMEVATLETNGNGHKNLLIHAIALYLEDTENAKKPKTYAAYKTALDYFAESCKKQTLAEIDRRDLLAFSTFLREEKKQSPRSVYNKFENVMTFLKANKIRDLVGKNDWPRYTEEEPEMYEPAELEKLFKACSSDERLWFEFFLMTGEREQEVMYTYWSDVNFSHSTVRVSHKPDRGWTPKAYKEREIPIPAKLVKSLKTHKTKADKTCNLVFPTAGCNPKLDFLDCLKAVAKRAGLNCKHCAACKSRGECERWFLHKFRATFATRCLWAGVDLRTVQLWLGHTDMESTMRYLKPSRSEGTNEKVNAIFA
jgi:integrase